MRMRNDLPQPILEISQTSSGSGNRQTYVLVYDQLDHLKLCVFFSRRRAAHEYLLLRQAECNSGLSRT
jgi:hypothetical protein